MELLGSYVYLIKELEMLLRPRFLDACVGEAVTGAQYTALTVLQRHPGITTSELARRSFVRAQSMAPTIDFLLDAGLVRRERDPMHGRRRLLYLTSHGVDTIVAITPAVVALERELIAGLSPEEERMFGDLLRRSRHALITSAAERASQSERRPEP